MLIVLKYQLGENCFTECNSNIAQNKRFNKRSFSNQYNISLVPRSLILTMIMSEIEYGYEVSKPTINKKLPEAPSGGLMREELLLISSGYPLVILI